MPITLNRTYQLRLETIGKRLTLYVDGSKLLEADDPTHPRGRSGVMMYKTRADIDNVVLTSHDRITLMEDPFQYSFVPDPWWQVESGTWANAGDEQSNYYEQAYRGRGTVVGGRNMCCIAGEIR